jgi:glycerol-3-phosphate dehydrogenase (NAD(P)+)
VTRLCVLGAGSWGTALAIAVSSRFESVRLWAHDPSRAAEMAEMRENRRYLPGRLLPPEVDVSWDMVYALEGAEIVLSVIPSRYLRALLETVRPHLEPRATFVSATKGLEETTLYRMSEVIAEMLPGHGVAVLSGPTFAKEIAAGEPAAVVIAADEISLAERMQRVFATPLLRFYASSDVVGVELGAALKNVIAIGAGICRGLGLGSNSVAALITRGLAEITRLAVSMGANPRTLSGLAGLGDLVLTATGDLSRNRFVGVQLGQGHKLSQILAGMSAVAEGITTCSAAHQLGIERRIDLPIVNKMYKVLYQDKDPRQAIRELMERPLTTE